MTAKNTVNPTVDRAARTISFYDAKTYTPDESVGYLMRRIIALAAQEIERELEPSGLTNAQWVPLFTLALGSATTGAELARECELDAGAMTRLLDRLETKGLCRRERSLEDRRVIKLEMTREGRQAAKVVPLVLSNVQNQLLAGFSLDEWQRLKDYLRRILDNAQALPSAKEHHDR